MEQLRSTAIQEISTYGFNTEDISERMPNIMISWESNTDDLIDTEGIPEYNVESTINKDGINVYTIKDSMSKEMTETSTIMEYTKPPCGSI